MWPKDHSMAWVRKEERERKEWHGEIWHRQPKKSKVQNACNTSSQGWVVIPTHMMQASSRGQHPSTHSLRSPGSLRAAPGSRSSCPATAAVGCGCALSPVSPTTAASSCPSAPRGGGSSDATGPTASGAGADPGPSPRGGPASAAASLPPCLVACTPATQASRSCPDRCSRDSRSCTRPGRLKQVGQVRVDTRARGMSHKCRVDRQGRLASWRAAVTAAGQQRLAQAVHAVASGSWVLKAPLGLSTAAACASAEAVLDSVCRCPVTGECRHASAVHWMPPSSTTSTPLPAGCDRSASVACQCSRLRVLRAGRSAARARMVHSRDRLDPCCRVSERRACTVSWSEGV